MNLDSPALPSAARFQALWARCGGAADVGSVHAALHARYAEPHRRYHTWAHVAHCLAEFDAAPVPAADAGAVELALWFHDVIYRTGASDNEQRSADLFSAYARPSLPAALVDEVVRLILITAHHAPPDAGSAAWVVDVDLSSFGLPWEDFLRDSRHVREEQADTDDARYYPAQFRFLRGLLARARIFTTDHFHARYEQRARDNVARLIADVEGGFRL